MRLVRRGPAFWAGHDWRSGVLAKCGNYLLNVGPRADGTIPGEAAAMLGAVGRWYRAIGESFDGAEPASALTVNRDVLLTKRGNALYVHLNRPPVTERVLLKPIAALPRKVTLLNTGEQLEARVDLLPTEVMGSGGLLLPPEEYLRIRGLPVDGAHDTALVIKLEFDRLPS